MLQLSAARACVQHCFSWGVVGWVVVLKRGHGRLPCRLLVMMAGLLAHHHLVMVECRCRLGDSIHLRPCCC